MIAMNTFQDGPQFAKAKQLLLSSDFAESMLTMELNCHHPLLVQIGDKTVWRADLNCFSFHYFVSFCSAWRGIQSPA